MAVAIIVYKLLTLLPRHMCMYLLMLIVTIVSIDTKQDMVHTNPTVLYIILLSSNHRLPYTTPTNVIISLNLYSVPRNYLPIILNGLANPVTHKSAKAKFATNKFQGILSF